MKTLTKKIRGVGTVRRKRVEARAAALIAKEMTLQELRQARKLTQVRLAKPLGITQDGVSRLKKRSDLLLSTCGRRSKPWVATCPWSLNSRIASQ